MKLGNFGEERDALRPSRCFTPNLKNLNLEMTLSDCQIC